MFTLCMLDPDPSRKMPLAYMNLTVRIRYTLEGEVFSILYSLMVLEGEKRCMHVVGLPFHCGYVITLQKLCSATSG